MFQITIWSIPPLLAALVCVGAYLRVQKMKRVPGMQALLALLRLVLGEVLHQSSHGQEALHRREVFFGHLFRESAQAELLYMQVVEVAEIVLQLPESVDELGQRPRHQRLARPRRTQQHHVRFVQLGRLRLLLLTGAFTL